MGLPCSKSKVKGDVLRSRANVLSRGQMAGPSSLAELCITSLADHHERLSAMDIEERLGRNGAQRLLDALILRGKLNLHVATLFSRAHLWQLELPDYPGVGNALFQVLSSGSLTFVDLSGAQVCPAAQVCPGALGTMYAFCFRVSLREAQERVQQMNDRVCRLTIGQCAL